MVLLNSKQLIVNAFKFPTLLFQAYNIVLLVLLSLAMFLFFNYDDPSPNSNSQDIIDPQTRTFILIFDPFLLMGIPLLIKWLLVVWDKKHNTELLKRYKRDLIIGFCGILFWGTMQLIIFYIYCYIGNSPIVIFLSFLFFTIQTIPFYMLFLHDATHFCRYSRPIQNQNMILGCTLLLHFILPTIALLTLRLTKNDKVLLGMGVVYHLYYFSIYAITTIEILVVCKDDIVLIAKGNLTENEDHRLPTSFECQICNLQYSDQIENRIPRILKECGHTVCHGCAENLSKQNSRQYILCPTCRTKTVVTEGSAKSLSKNYAILNVIREINSHPRQTTNEML